MKLFNLSFSGSTLKKILFLVKKKKKCLFFSSLKLNRNTEKSRVVTNF